MSGIRLWAARRPWLAVALTLLACSVLTPISADLAAGAWVLCIVVVVANRFALRSEVQARASRPETLSAQAPHSSDLVPHQPGAAPVPPQAREGDRGGRGAGGRVARVGRSGGQSAPALVDVLHAGEVLPLAEDLDEQLEVAGEQYHVKGVRGVFREEARPITEKGTTLNDLGCTLVPMPWNENDENAVAVMIGSHHVGYLERETAAEYAPHLNALASRRLLVPGRARLWAQSEGGMIRARVTLAVPTVDDLPRG